jgi:hypothetical protein
MTLLLEHDTDVMTKTTTGSGDRPACSHIVGPSGGKSGQTRVTEAMVFGHEVEALCGHVWIPSRDPQGLPVCPPCKSAAERMGGRV